MPWGSPPPFRSPFSLASSQGGPLSVLEETELKAGKFGVIRSLLRTLDQGAAAKAALDAAIDACAGMQNLREAIASYRGRLYYEANDARRQDLMHVSSRGGAWGGGWGRGGEHSGAVL